ncbi:MAG: rhomboid family intramembrane serine protease [Candidatus Dormibacteria bacterium]|jgi:membrane associated rhomboid family serine protease
MTQTTPPGEEALPPQPPALARAVAMQLVTRYRLRLADSRDPRLGELGPDYELAAVGWTGARSALVAFFRPPADPAAQVADLHRRIGAALRWGDARLHVQGAQRCDILLVALGPLGVRLPQAAHPAVSVGVVWADTATGAADAVLPPPPGTPTVREIRATARTLHDGAEAPTLAAVDLAERQAVAGGTVAPARRVLLATPRLTYIMVGVFVGIFLIENTVINRYSAQAYGDLGYLGSGALSFGESGLGQNGSDWWRFLSTAFLHVPGGIGVSSYLSVHLLVNCYSTVILGRIVEPLYGRLMMLATFVATAFVASLVSVGAAGIGLPGAAFATVGASGGLMGLLGLLLVLGRRQGRDVPAGLVRALRQGVIISVILTAAIGFIVPNVNNYAHLGGFCAGALIGLVMPPVRAVGGRDLALWQKGALATVVAVGAVAMLFAAVNLVSFLSSVPASPTAAGL